MNLTLTRIGLISGYPYQHFKSLILNNISVDKFYPITLTKESNILDVQNVDFGDVPLITIDFGCDSNIKLASFPYLSSIITNYYTDFKLTCDIYLENINEIVIPFYNIKTTKFKFYALSFTKLERLKINFFFFHLLAEEESKFNREGSIIDEMIVLKPEVKNKLYNIKKTKSLKLEKINIPIFIIEYHEKPNWFFSYGNEELHIMSDKDYHKELTFKNSQKVKSITIKYFDYIESINFINLDNLIDVILENERDLNKELILNFSSNKNENYNVKVHIKHKSEMIKVKASKNINIAFNYSKKK